MVIVVAVMVVMEIPSGYFADVFGRKLSVVLGGVLFLVSMVMFAVGDSFWIFVLAEVIGGLGLSFHSGANEALAYDTLLEMGEERRYKKIYGNMYFAKRVAGTLGAVVGGLLATPMVHSLQQLLPELSVIIGGRKFVVFGFDIIRRTIQDRVIGSLEHRDVVVGIPHGNDLVVQGLHGLRNLLFAVRLPQVIAADGAVTVNAERIAKQGRVAQLFH